MDLKNLKSVFIIAEIGQNHQGDIALAKKVMKERKHH
jgi:sialic acid synthase SpsE